MTPGQWRMGVRHMPGGWRWCVFNRNGTLVMVSRELYADRAAAVTGANIEAGLLQQVVLVV